MTTPNDPTMSHDSLDAVIAAYLLAVEAGEVPNRRELLDHHPEHADALRAFFADLDRMDRVASPLRVAGGPDETGGADANGHTALPTVRYFGDYELLEEIARGGMGIVYKARQVSLNRLVALKMILAGSFASNREVQRFRTEAEAAANLDHPHIVPIYEVGEHDGQQYYSMKFVEGTSLAKHARGDPRTEVEGLVGVIRAVHHAHQRGVLHRDLKPSNVLVDSQGTLLVTDFGLAKRLSSGDRSFTETGQVLGTPKYMAPEQAAGRKDLTVAADVYSLGAILYERLTGQTPFTGDNAMTLLRQAREAEPPRPSTIRPGLDRDLETVILKCLEKEPDRRYPSAEALADDLANWLAGRPIAARPVGQVERFWRWCRRNPVVAGAAGLVAASLVVVAVLSLLYADRQARLATAERLRIEEQTQYSRKQAENTARIAAQAKALEKKSQDLATSLADSNRRLAMLHFERAQRAFDGGQVNHGLLWLLETWRYAAKADDRAWQHLARASLSHWRYHCPELKGVFPHAYGWRAAFSPDGKWIVAKGWDGARLWIWDVATASPDGLPILGNGSMPVAFSPDGKRILTTSDANTAQAWDIASRRHIGPPMKHEGSVSDLAYSPDGKTVLTISLDPRRNFGGGDSVSMARLWNAATGQAIGAPLRHQVDIPFAFSPDSKTILTGSDGEACLWNASTAKPIGQPMAHRGFVTSVAFSPDGRIALTSAGVSVQMWDAGTTRPIRPPLVHEETVNSAAFSPDGKTILSVSADAKARRWDAATGQPIGRPLAHQGAIASVAYSPDGKTILTASSDKTARLWDAMTGQPVGHIFRHEEAAESAVFSPDGRSVLTESTDGVARLWDAGTTQSIGMPLEHPGDVYAIAFSPDGRAVLTGGPDGTARLWDAASGDSIGKPMTHFRSDVTSAAFSSDGTTILTGSRQGPVSLNIGRLWDAKTLRPIGQPMAHPDNAYASQIALSPDGMSVLGRRGRASAQLWNAATSRPIGKLLKPAPAVIFSPDGKTLLTASKDGKVVELDAATGRAIREHQLDLHGDSPFVFRPDGQVLCAWNGENTLRQWVIATGQPMGEPMVHRGSVEFLQYSPHGNLLLTESNVTNVVGDGSHDVKLRLWDAATGRPIGRPLAHKHIADSLLFSPDGKTFLGGVPAQLWDSATAQPIGALLEPGRVVHQVAFRPDGRMVALVSSDREGSWTASLHRLPTLIDEDLPRMTSWIQTITGLAVNDEGSVNALAWQDRRQGLQRSGGPPKTDARWSLDPILYGSQPTARARAWMDRGRWTEVEQAFTEAVDARPRNVAILLQRGDFYASRLRTREAEADFARAYLLGGRDERLLRTIMASGTILERVVAAAPGDSAELWARLGQNRARQQHWSEAAECFSKALGLEPDALSLRINQMRALLGAGDFGAARQVCSDMLGRFGDTDRPAMARNVAKQCALIPGAVADAEVLVRIAERAAEKRYLFSKHLDLHALGVTLYRAGRYQEAISRLNQAIDARNGNEEPLGWPFLAMAHYRLGHPGEALRWLDKLRNRQPSTDPNQFWKELEIRLLSSEAEAVVLYDPVFPADPFAH